MSLKERLGGLLRIQQVETPRTPTDEEVEIEAITNNPDMSDFDKASAIQAIISRQLKETGIEGPLVVRKNSSALRVDTVTLNPVDGTFTRKVVIEPLSMSMLAGTPAINPQRTTSEESFSTDGYLSFGLEASRSISDQARRITLGNDTGAI